MLTSYGAPIARLHGQAGISSLERKECEILGFLSFPVTSFCSKQLLFDYFSDVMLFLWTWKLGFVGVLFCFGGLKVLVLGFSRFGGFRGLRFSKGSLCGAGHLHLGICALCRGLAYECLL